MEFFSVGGALKVWAWLILVLGILFGLFGLFYAYSTSTVGGSGSSLISLRFVLSALVTAAGSYTAFLVLHGLGEIVVALTEHDS